MLVAGRGRASAGARSTLLESTGVAAPSGKQSKPITIAVDEFPPVLNNMTTAGNGAWTAMIAGPALARGYKLMPDFSYQPWLFAKDCEVTEHSPFTVDCQIRPEAKWSDGVPITSNDFKFTYDTIMNTKNDVVTRDGYDKITAFNVLSPTEFQMVFQEVFAPYRELWAGAEHHRAPDAHPRGQELQQGLEQLHLQPQDQEADQQRPDDGAVVHARRAGHARAQQELLGRARWPPCPKVVFVPVRDTNSELNAFRSGEVDVIYPQNQIGLRKKIEAVDGAEYTTDPRSAVGALRHALDRARARRPRRCARPSPPRCPASRSSTAS